MIEDLGNKVKIQNGNRIKSQNIIILEFMEKNPDILKGFSKRNNHNLTPKCVFIQSII